MSDVRHLLGQDQRDPSDVELSLTLRGLAAAPPPEATASEPTDEELARYIDGAATGSERTLIEAKIEARPRALARVARVTAALTECGFRAATVEAPAAIGKRVARYAFRLADEALSFLRGSSTPIGGHAAATALALRGSATTEQLGFFEFVTPLDDDVEAHLKVEQVSTTGLEIAVRLDRKGTALDGARVTLRREGRSVDSAATEGGECLFRGLDVARWEIEVRRGPEPLGAIRVDVLD